MGYFFGRGRRYGRFFPALSLRGPSPAATTVYITLDEGGFCYQCRGGRARGSDLREISAEDFVQALNRRAAISTWPSLAIVAIGLAALLSAAILWFVSAASERVEAKSPSATATAAGIVTNADRGIHVGSGAQVAVIEISNPRPKRRGQSQPSQSPLQELKRLFRGDPAILFLEVRKPNRFVRWREGINWQITLVRDSGQTIPVSFSEFPAVIVLDSAGIAASFAGGGTVGVVDRIKAAIAATRTENVPVPAVPTPSRISPRRPEHDSTPEEALASVGIIGLVSGLALKRRLTVKKALNIAYELDEPTRRRLSGIQAAFRSLSQTTRIWHVASRGPAYEWDRAIGTERHLVRSVARCAELTIPGVWINVPVPGIKFGSVQLYALPDQMLCRSRGRFTALAYSELTVTAGKARFAESKAIPDDSQILGETSKFPDKHWRSRTRSRRNARVPVLAYGQVVLQSAAMGLAFRLYTSSVPAASEFEARFSPLRFEARSTRSRRPHLARDVPPEIAERYRAASELGISPHATSEDVSTAYKKLARMYHPDKVVELSPEMRAAAELKMKIINQAYAVMKKSVAGLD